MTEFGLLGRKLPYSYSPQIHAMLGNYAYSLIEREEDELDSFFGSFSYGGINVTIPYKTVCMRYCDSVSGTAERVGCVNTIVRGGDGRLYGYNTDYSGFRYLLEKNSVDPQGKRVLILGSGGAAHMVRQLMLDLGASRADFVSRTGKLNYGNVYGERPGIIVNASPVGTAPECAAPLIDISRFPTLETVIDLIYNPARTQIMLDAERLGLKSAGGLEMLVSQAAASAELFTGSPVPPELVEEITGKMRREGMNLALIGMPGAGKTTVGRKLSEITGRPFYDTDELFAGKTGVSPGDFILKYGEPEFRKRETEVIAEISAKNSAIIACGGGVPTIERNIELLRRNSRTVWIKRNISELPKEGRPLSGNRQLESMYEERRPFYERAADFTADNRGIDECAEKIKEITGI